MPSEAEHLNLLREMRNSLRTLPDDLVRRLASGPGGGLFPVGRPRRDRAGAAGEPGAEKKGPGEQLRAVENAGFALSRFVPLFGQIAGFSRDIRAVMDAFKDLGKMRAEGTTVATAGGFGKAAAARKDTAEQQQEVLKGFNARQPDWLTRAAMEGKQRPPMLGTPAGPGGLKLSGVNQPAQPPPSDEQLSRALNALGRGPKYMEKSLPLPPQPQRSGPPPLTTPGPGGAALFPGLQPPEPAPALPAQPLPAPLPGGAQVLVPRAPAFVPPPSPMEGFGRTGAGGTPPAAPVLTGGMGQQLAGKLDQLIALATGQRQQQQDDASDTPDDKTRHTEELGGEVDWQQHTARQEAGAPASSLLPAALAGPNPARGGESSLVESIIEKIAIAAVTAGMGL